MPEDGVDIISYITDETANDPTADKIQCKFIVVHKDGSLHAVVIGEYERFPFHAHIVQQFCRDHDVSVQTKHGGEDAVITDSQYEITGGGWLEIDRKARVLRWYGASKAYGKFKEASIELVSTDSGHWQGYRSLVE